MMFILRLMFWLMVVCLLLPSQHEDNRRLASSASKAVADLRGFCTRNPDVCDDARLVARDLLARVKTGAEAVEGWMSQPNEQPSWSSAPYAPDAARTYERTTAAQWSREPVQPAPQWKNSLSSTDRGLPWQGPGE